MSKPPPQPSTPSPENRAGYDVVLRNIFALLEAARQAAARTVNALMTTTYWQIGQHIVELEQSGEERAAYGQAVLDRLSHDLTTTYKRGFSGRNLRTMRFLSGLQNQRDSADTVCRIPVPASRLD